MQKPALQATVNFVLKYRLLDIVFWVYSYITLLHMYEGDKDDPSFMYFDVTAIKFFQVCCVYFVVEWLMPKYLYKKNRLRFLFYALLAIVLSAVLTVLAQDLHTLFKLGRHLRNRSIYIMFLSNLFDATLFTTVFFTLYTLKDRHLAEKKTARLEKEKLENELNFLKAQLNPHFLFNAINSIYVLIREDKDLASKTLLKFSNLLRYQLYDCTQDWVSLENEIGFLKDYVDLEQVRNDTLKITFDGIENDRNLEIAPFILTAFVENSFKHRSSNLKGNYVTIRAALAGKTLDFTVENTFNGAGEPLPDAVGGIGLQNVYRRLELLYPGKHEVNVVKTDDIYRVNLKLNLHENSMYSGG